MVYEQKKVRFILCRGIVAILTNGHLVWIGPLTNTCSLNTKMPSSSIRKKLGGVGSWGSMTFTVAQCLLILGSEGFKLTIHNNDHDHNWTQGNNLKWGPVPTWSHDMFTKSKYKFKFSSSHYTVKSIRILRWCQRGFGIVPRRLALISMHMWWYIRNAKWYIGCYTTTVY